jgi:hypothetical protein
LPGSSALAFATSLPLLSPVPVALRVLAAGSALFATELVVRAEPQPASTIDDRKVRRAA